MAKTLSLASLVPILLAPGLAAQSHSNECCSVLQSRHPDHTYFDDTPIYNLEAFESYWSTTARLAPACVFTPDSTALVSSAVRLFTEKNCSFAIRSGGHSPSAGWANIDGGVLLATTNLSSLSLGDDFVSVGSGLRWGAVYDYLDPHGLVVLGGRGVGVGVSGLVLGGGISHFTPKHGLACDNVKGFEIVTASGEILEANAETHADLWQALKGALNTFGVVTRFDLYTYPSPQLHSVTGQISMENFDQVANALDDYIRLASYEEAAEEMAVSLVSYYVSALGEPLLTLGLISMSGEDEKEPWVKGNQTSKTKPDLPEILSDFQHLPYASLNEEWGTMSDFAVGADTPTLRYDLRTFSFQSSAEMLKGMRRIFEEEFAPVYEQVTDFSGIVEWQLITANAVAQGVEKGGNVLGLEGYGPMILLTMANSWSDAAGDDIAYAAGHRVVERGQALAKELGTYVPFVYANYAAEGQDVLASYGASQVCKLGKVKAKYDSDNAFNTIVPGGLSGQFASRG